MTMFTNGYSSLQIPEDFEPTLVNIEGEMLLHRLDLMGISVATGSACNSKETVLSHVIRAIKVPEEYANGTIRISLGNDNNEEQIERIAACIKKIISR